MSDREIRSPSVGSVTEILVQAGSTVTEGQELLMIEVMKMLIPVVTGVSGKVSAIMVTPGQMVQEGDVLMVLE